MHRFMSLRKPQLTIQYANKMTLIFALSGGDILHLQISSVFQFLFQLSLDVAGTKYNTYSCLDI